MFFGPRGRVYLCSKNSWLTKNEKKSGGRIMQTEPADKVESWFQGQSYWCCGNLQPQSPNNYSSTKGFLRLWLFFSWQISIPWMTDTQQHQACSRVTCFYNTLCVQTSPLTQCFDCRGVMPGKSLIHCVLSVPVRDQISNKIITAYKGVLLWIHTHSDFVIIILPFSVNCQSTAQLPLVQCKHSSQNYSKFSCIRYKRVQII